MSRRSNPRKAVAIALLSCALCACGIGSNTLRPDGGGLADCDGGPHCVSSSAGNPERRIEPLHYAGSRESARRRLLAVLGAMPRLTLVESQPDYIHAEVRTPLMRYVDDLEFLFAVTAPMIEVRSSSRIGYYDFGVNRERIDAIREDFARSAEAAPTAP